MKIPGAQFSIQTITDSFVLIIDLDQGRTVTNDAKNVVSSLRHQLSDGLGLRRIFYRDTCGRFDELKHIKGAYDSIAPCTDSQQPFFSRLTQDIGAR